MSIQTHRNFQSLEPYIKNAQDIYNNIKQALIYQSIYNRTTTPQEIQTWDYEELQRITIDVEKIDRLYYMEYHYDNKVTECEIIIRMIYKDNQYVFIKLYASFDWTNNKPEGTGDIFISRCPKFFATKIFYLKNVNKFILNDNNVNPRNLISFKPLPEQHPYFKSLVSYIPNLIDIYPKIYGALLYQKQFERKIKNDLTSWDHFELKNVEINVELIDRLYFMEFYRDEKNIIIKLVIRMDYYNKYPVYINLLARIDYTKSIFQPNGVIIISKDKKLFANEINSSNIKTLILTDNYFDLAYSTNDEDDDEDDEDEENEIRKRRRNEKILENTVKKMKM